MKLPRDVSGEELVRILAHLGYQVVRQTGSHVRLTTHQNGEHHLTIPRHDPIKIGLLNAVLREVSTHHQIHRDELVRILFS